MNKNVADKTVLLVAVLLIVIGITVGLVLLTQSSDRQYEYNGRLYRPGETFLDADGCNTCSFSQDGQLQCTLMACVDEPVEEPAPAEDVIDLSFSYSDGTYVYSGTIQKPTPCHTVEADIVVRERFPEDVDLKFTIIDSGQICSQVIDEEPVSGEIAVSEGATISVFVNGQRQSGVGVN
jgi:hypothetical protein